MATEYYRELIKRNLIQPTKEYSLTGYGCTVHDVVRTIAEYVAREEPLVVIGREQAATGGVGGVQVDVLLGDNLTHVENIPSVVELDVFDCPELKKITALDSRLQKIRIVRCTKLEVLEGVPALDSLVLEDSTMDTLPEYLQAVNPRYLRMGQDQPHWKAQHCLPLRWRVCSGKLHSFTMPEVGFHIY
ncbi:unnamed protein product [Miscanthus lutarioriparius]|uniref:Uncharacterized protein n=1 Tax=Miscanthus lutarioriparius TaxID=422564 RepID=A0A811QDQ5_9POAL|nr:unnamed protein product [Miscanthus lutarioriparius]